VLTAASRDLERRLARALDLEERAVREYVIDVLEHRLWGERHTGARKTGLRFVRGSHGGRYVRDPDGSDVLPVGHEAPPEDARS
jgi:hypothetical protein